MGLAAPGCARRWARPERFCITCGTRCGGRSTTCAGCSRITPVPLSSSTPQAAAASRPGSEPRRARRDAPRRARPHGHADGRAQAARVDPPAAARDRSAARAPGVIAALVDRPSLLNEVRASLKSVRDIERTVGRLSQGGGNGRDLQALGQSLRAVPSVRESVASMALEAGPLAKELLERLGTSPNSPSKSSGRSSMSRPPRSRTAGSSATAGTQCSMNCAAPRSRARTGSPNSRRARSKRTGIKSLKVRYNSVFGYFIEITKSNLSSTPPHYHRKQTIANAERFITPELKQMEDKILGAEERAKKLELELFHELRRQILDPARRPPGNRATPSPHSMCSAAWPKPRASSTTAARCSTTATTSTSRMAAIRCSTRICRRRAIRAQRRGNRTRARADSSHHRPEHGGQIDLHPPGRAAHADGADRQLHSRFERRDRAGRPHLHPRRRERRPLARPIHVHGRDERDRAILNNATDRSLVILDEIGRGTSTFDGLSLAWSIAEHLHDEIGCRALFATHYHETDGARENAPGPAELQRRRARVERPDHLPPQNRRRSPPTKATASRSPASPASRMKSSTARKRFWLTSNPTPPPRKPAACARAAGNAPPKRTPTATAFPPPPRRK